MFRNISSAAADTHSFSSLASPFTRQSKPTLLNSRSLLQMFWKISLAAAADAHSFSSLASPPKPTPLNSRNSTSRFTIPAGTTSSRSNSWIYGREMGDLKARLKKFFRANCDSRDVSVDEAFCFFHRMVQVEPRFPVYSFNLLLQGLSENLRYDDVFSLYGKMNSIGLSPNFVTLNILLRCLCYASRVSDALLVLGRIMRMGISPNINIFNYLIEGLSRENRVADAVRLFGTLEKFDCSPDLTTCGILAKWISIWRSERDAPRFNKEMTSENDQDIDCLCKQGKENKATERSSDVDVPGHKPLSVNLMAEHVKGQEELKLNIHSKEKAPTCLARETPHDQTLLNSRSLLQLVWKISHAAAADAHSFSSLASPPKPTPLNSRNSTSRFTIPAGTTSPSPNNWLYGQEIGDSKARLEKFFRTNCECRDVSVDEAFCFFHRMVQMEPRFPVYSFNLLLQGLAENLRYDDVLSLYGKMNSVGLIPNFVTLNILLRCLCYANRVSDGFMVMGRIMRMGYRPNMKTFSSLFEGLLIGNRLRDAVRLSRRLEFKYDQFSYAINIDIVRRAAYGPGYTRDAPRFNKEMTSENDQDIDSLCKQGKENKAMERSSDVDVPGHKPLSVNLMAEHVKKGQEELKLNIHSKEKAPACLARETHHMINPI